MARGQDMNGRVVLVTGATTGIGRVTAARLAERGARVLVHGRDEQRTAAAARAIGGEPLVADFASLAAVHGLADAVLAGAPRLDVLVNNAGLMRDRFVATEDGFETTFQVNHLAPFVLTTRLLDRLRASAPARIVNVASRMHERVRRFALDDLARPAKFEGFEAYCRSKACNVLFTVALAARLDGTGVVANSLHPGFVASRFGRDGDLGFGYETFFRLLRPMMISVEAGARTSLWLVADAPATMSGRHFDRERERRAARFASNPATAEALWAWSERLTAVC